MTCEALLITRTSERRPGDRCPELATHTHADRRVCWVHAQACVGPRAARCPVQFVPKPTP